MLKSIFKRSSAAKGLLGVFELPSGLAIAQVVRREGDRPLLSACGFFASEREDERRRKLQEFVKANSLVKSPCVGILEPGNYSVLQVEPPEVPEEEMKEAVRWGVKDLIDYPLDEAVIDFFLLPEHNIRGRVEMAYAIAARKSIAEQKVATIRGAKLDIEILDIPELALRNVSSFLPQDEMGMALVYFGERSGLITVSRQGRLYLSRNINVGAADLEVASAEGEEALEDYHSSFRGMLDSVILEIQRSLDFYESNFAQPPLRNLIVVPPHPSIPGMLSFFQTHLDLTVGELDLSEVLECPELSAEDQANCLIAIGGALREEGAGS